MKRSGEKGQNEPRFKKRAQTTDGHKVDCPTIDVKQVAPNVPKDDAPNKRLFYAL